MRLPSWPGAPGVQVIAGRIPHDAVPPSTSMDKPEPKTGTPENIKPPKPGRCTCDHCPNCGGIR